MQSPMQHQNLQVWDWKNGGLKQLIGVCYGEISQLDQGDYHLFHCSLVYTEDLHAKKKIMAPFQGWDSTIPWLQNHYEDII